MKKVCILGQGYIGLPSALMFATHGLKVLGMDVNREIIHTSYKKKHKEYLLLQIDQSENSNDKKVKAISL